MELNPDIDLAVDTSDLSTEFRKFSLVLYRYCQYKAKVKTQRDLAKAKLKEVRALVYKRIKSDITSKHTEKSLEAEIDTDAEVIEANLKLIRLEHDVDTWEGAVDSMRAKKDMIMQIGADLRRDK